MGSKADDRQILDLTTVQTKQRNPFSFQVVVDKNCRSESTVVETKKVNMERTYIMIKPDGVQRGLVGEIIKRFEQKGFLLLAMKLTQPSKEHMEKHYEDLKEKKFFPGLIEYMTSGPVVAMVWSGKNVVLEGRKMLGKSSISWAVNRGSIFRWFSNLLS